VHTHDDGILALSPVVGVMTPLRDPGPVLPGPSLPTDSRPLLPGSSPPADSHLSSRASSQRPRHRPTHIAREPAQDLAAARPRAAATIDGVRNSA
jgi:hypothetical protein